MTPRPMQVALIVVLLLGAAPALCTLAAAEDNAAPVDFPRYPAIEDNVRFWTRVFSEWSLAQVVVHDLDHPAIVYDVVDLPGPVEERYTDEQRSFVEDLNELWKDRLRALQRKIAGEETLSDAEKRWALLLASHAGTDAVERADERIRTQRGLRERFRRGIEISSRYDKIFREIFAAEGLPEELAYLPHVESSFQARARSSAGAVGVWQFTRGTGRLYMKINSAIDERLDPVASARAAAAYLRDAYAKLDSWPLALTGYNHGVAGMQRAAERLGGDYERIFKEYRGRLFGFASKNFYSEFLAAMDIASDPERYFPEGFTHEPPLELDSVELNGRTTPGLIARAYEIDLAELQAINPGWSSRAVRSGLALPKGIRVWLPRGTISRLEAEGIRPDYTLAGWIDEGGQYVVQPGDSLSVIAGSYGLSIRRLRELNGMGPADSLIRVGQRLRLGDAADAAVHVVRRGENLSTIARAYGMPLAALRTLNGLAPNDDLIHVGQRLRVRGAAETESATVHIVRAGETLLRIALVYGVRLHDLMRINRLHERSIIRPGQRLVIPG